jgi:hypothetical protein
MKRTCLLLMCTMAALACARELPPLPVDIPGNPGWLGPPPAVTIYSESDQHIHLQDSAALLHARWQGATTTDRQRVELVTPQGRVYEVLEAPLNPAGEAEVRLALGGTMVEDFKLHGTWTARFYINAGTAPVKEVPFEVQP